MSNDYHVRKFFNDRGLHSVEVNMDQIGKKTGAFDVSFNLTDEYRPVSFYWSFYNREDYLEHYKECFEFFETLRDIGEQGMDELAKRWVTLKENDNAETESDLQEREEDQAERSDRIDERGTTSVMQEEFDFD